LNIGFFFLTANLSAEGRVRKGFSKETKFYLPIALKARPVAAMGATHGIESPYDSPSRPQPSTGDERQMREYGDE